MFDDCDGCNSGTFKSGFNFLLSRKDLQGLLNNDSDYPWIGSKSECKFEPEKCVDLINGVSWKIVWFVQRSFSFLFLHIEIIIISKKTMMSAET